MKQQTSNTIGAAVWIASCAAAASIVHAEEETQAAPAASSVAGIERTEREREPRADVDPGPVQPDPNGAPEATGAQPAPERPDDMPPELLPERNAVEGVPLLLPDTPLPEDPSDPNDIAVPGFGLTSVDPAPPAAFLWMNDPVRFPWQELPGFSSTGIHMAPSGFDSIATGLRMSGLGTGTPAAGLGFSGSVSGLYNSNVSPGSPASSGGADDDFILTFSGTAIYRSQPRDLSYSAFYQIGYSEYLNDSGLSGYNHGLGISGRYDGGKFTVAADFHLSSEQGANRYYSSRFVRQTGITTGVDMAYHLSPKTSITAGIGYRLSIVDDDDFDNTESLHASLAAMWKYSPITELGAGIRYTFDSGGSSDPRTSIGPELILNYKLSDRIDINTRLGLEFPQSGGGGSSDPSVAGSASLNYTPSPLWGMSVSLYSGTQADASESGIFTQVSSVRLGYYRNIRSARVQLGVSWETDDNEFTESLPSHGRLDGENLALDASVGMPAFSSSTYATISARYNSQSGGASGDWDSFQIGFSINHSF